MTDQEIADALVGAGILSKKHWYGNRYLEPNEAVTLEGSSPIRLTHYFIGKSARASNLLGGADNAISDWRTAGACLERMPQTNCFTRTAGWGVEMFTGDNPGHFVTNDSLPRAICEAFVTAQPRQEKT